MKRRTLCAVACLLAVVLMGVAGVSAAEKFDADPKHQLPRPDTKAADMTKPVKVFILMGQSNMFGMGEVGPETKQGTLEYLTKKEKRYPYLLDDAGKWTARSDVRYVQVMPGKGGGMQTLHNEWLTVKGKTIGPEVAFGYIMGHVLGRTRPHSQDLHRKPQPGLGSSSARQRTVSRLPTERQQSTVCRIQGHAGFLGQRADRRKVTWYAGKQYDDDLANAKTVLSEHRQVLSRRREVRGRRLCLVAGAQGSESGPCRPLRAEPGEADQEPAARTYNAPNAPFVLATIGFGGWKLGEPGLTIANAQLAVGDPKKHPEFAGNVKTVESRDFWREADVSPTNQGYHYNRNAGTYMEVGNALGWAMAELLGKQGK